MSEIYGPQTYKQHLEAKFNAINPNCHCTPSKIVRARGIKLIMNSGFSETQAETGVQEVLGDCPKSKSVSICCDLVAKCTNVELIDASLDEMIEKVDAAIGF